MFHNFFILFSSVSPSTACCLFSLDTTCPNNHISFIHHMLLFICNAPTLRCKSQDFNTSHVTLYQFNNLLDEDSYKVSIHLMLLFIYLFALHAGALVVCFNTSHVTLYPKPVTCALIFCSFQYISCYSLSNSNRNNLQSVSWFQYISCYSLSEWGV